MKNLRAVYILIGLLCCYSLLIAGDGDKVRMKRVVERTSEQTLQANISIHNGLLYLRRASESQLFNGEVLYAGEQPFIGYEVINHQGILSLSFGDEDEDVDGDIDVNISKLYENECYLNFSDSVPLDLKLECGVVKGTLSFGGLSISNCSIQAAAGKATIDFGEPNTVLLDELTIENGVGSLRVYNLNNANFGFFSMEAGVGSYVLDFGGELRRSAQVDIQLGAGKLTIRLPRDAAARMEVDASFLTSVDITNMFREEGDTYHTRNWENAKHRLDFSITCGAGKVAVEWIE